jgi:hypothetical protein
MFGTHAAAEPSTGAMLEVEVGAVVDGGTGKKLSHPDIAPVSTTPRMKGTERRRRLDIRVRAENRVVRAVFTGAPRCGWPD